MNLLLAVLLCAASSRAAGDDAVEQLLQTKGEQVRSEFKVTVPQQDLSVLVDGFRITPPMGLTTWIAFSPGDKHAMAMGDLVVLEDEAAAVERAAQAAGYAVTGLHNHFLRDQPKVMFMHVEGMGAMDALTGGASKILAKVRELRAAKKLQGQATVLASSLDAGLLDRVLGRKGSLNDGVLKYTIGRPDVALEHEGMPVSTLLGFNTWAAFQGTPERAAVAGDFAMLDGEVKDVIKALTDGGLEVTAIHNHMIGEKPRVVFLHYWGVGKAEDLARALRAALDKTGTKKESR